MDKCCDENNCDTQFQDLQKRMSARSSSGYLVALYNTTRVFILRELLPAPGTGTCTGTNPLSDSYRLVADSGFNAIAYGLGNNETYAYSAGTNVKDLYQQIGVQSEYGIEPTPSVCKGSPFKFKVSLPYCADSIKWDLSLLPGLLLNQPQFFTPLVLSVRVVPIQQLW